MKAVIETENITIPKIIPIAIFVKNNRNGRWLDSPSNNNSPHGSDVSKLVT